LAPHPLHPSDPRIVIPIVAGIGNALLAVPMVRQLKRKLPAAHVTVLAMIPPMADVYRRLDEVDETIVTGKGVKGLWRMIRESRRRKPDVFLIPFPSNRWQYAVIAALSGARRRVMHGYPVGYFSAMHFLPADRLPAERHVHDVRQNLNLLRMLGVEPDVDEPPTFRVTNGDRARAAELLERAGASLDAHPIVIHAGSARTALAAAKRWPPAAYARLIGEIQRERGDRVVLVEGPDEAGVANEILKHAPAGAAPPKVVRLLGPLGDAAALLERAELYVGSDSGLAHLAAAVGTPAVTIFAPADPERVCPFGNRDLVAQAAVACSPCAQYPWHATEPRVLCREPYCVTLVTVEQVIDRVRAARARESRRAEPRAAGTSA
jgi:ADP-heptose:LPS heptosyltransferase